MVRRILFGAFWFVIFALALLVAGGGIAGAMAGGQAPPTGGEGFVAGYNKGYDVGVQAGIEFRERYGWVVLTVAGVLAAAGSVTGVLPGTRR